MSGSRGYVRLVAILVDELIKLKLEVGVALLRNPKYFSGSCWCRENPCEEVVDNLGVVECALDLGRLGLRVVAFLRNL